MKPKIILSIIALSGILMWTGLQEYWRLYNPSKPDVNTGRIYELPYHGTSVYLNKTEQTLRYGLPVLFFITLITGLILYRKNKEKSGRRK